MSRDLPGAGPVTVHDLPPTGNSLRDDVRVGLSARPRKLPPKYFYDDLGAQLFDRITTLPAYYLTRTELGILEQNVDEIVEGIGPRVRLVEFGSGSGSKTRSLLRRLEAPSSYVPIDIARTQLVEFAGAVAEEFPDLDVRPVWADYTDHWTPPWNEATCERTVAFFPGSTIGNFEPADAGAFLRHVGHLCGPGGGFLVGVDLHKDRSVLERAYDDPEGVTAAFNLNLLERINRECGTDFDVTEFRHRAVYDSRHRRVEMQLVARHDSVVTMPARANGARPTTFAFAADDFIITEYSHKYTLESFEELVQRSGWSVERVWTDEQKWFSVWLLAVPT